MSEPAAIVNKIADLPQHVAVIMDGNGRWARSRGLPRLAGHRASVRVVRAELNAAFEFFGHRERRFGRTSAQLAVKADA